MARIVDIACPSCGLERENVRVERGEPYPDCACGTRMEWVPSGTVNWEWSHGRFFNGIDQHFDSRSDLTAYLKGHGLAQAPEADRHHGARHEDYLHLGKKYSYRDQRTRSGPKDKRYTT